MMPCQSRSSIAALAVLIILQTVMLTALYAGVPPHPPVATPLFGIAPFLGASMGTAAAAIILGTSTSRAGAALSLLATVMALVSFGPQKYLDAQFGLIWPAVIVPMMLNAPIKASPAVPAAADRPQTRAKFGK